MGHPGGERERSEAAEQHITRRADLLFQVMVVMVMVDLKIVMVELVVTKRVTKNVMTMTVMILK